MNWKGGKHVAWNGYIRVLKRGHPRALSNGYVWEHILVAEKKLGRPLRYFGKGDPRNECVHHINGDKTDNRSENIEIFVNQGKHLKHEWETNREKFPQANPKNSLKYKNWLKRNCQRLG